MVHQEIPGPSVRSLAADGRGRVLAIVDGHWLYRRSPDGDWTAIAKSEFELSCCVPIGKVVFVGTNDAHILRVDPDGAQQYLTGFDAVEGRDRWYAGAAIIDGKRLGPPLGVRSMTATCDDAVLLANVHVGGILRSTDAGLTWRPTVDIDSDVHQVCAHPTRPDIVIAAAAGLYISRDAGATWAEQSRGSSDDPSPLVNIEFYQTFVAHLQKEGLAGFFIHDIGAFHDLIDLERLLAKCIEDILPIIQHDYSLQPRNLMFTLERAV